MVTAIAFNNFIRKFLKFRSEIIKLRLILNRIINQTHENKMQNFLLFAAIALLLSACSYQRPSTNTPTIGRVVEEWTLSGSQKDQCQAQYAAKLVGQKNLSEDDIKVMTQAGFVRVLQPDQPATMDYRSDRVTVVTDRDNKVVSASCG